MVAKSALMKVAEIGAEGVRAVSFLVGFEQKGKVRQLARALFDMECIGTCSVQQRGVDYKMVELRPLALILVSAGHIVAPFHVMRQQV